MGGGEVFVELVGERAVVAGFGDFVPRWRIGGEEGIAACPSKLQRRISAKPVVGEFPRQRIGEGEGDEDAYLSLHTHLTRFAHLTNRRNTAFATKAKRNSIHIRHLQSIVRQRAKQPQVRQILDNAKSIWCQPSRRFLSRFTAFTNGVWLEKASSAPRFNDGMAVTWNKNARLC